MNQSEIGSHIFSADMRKKRVLNLVWLCVGEISRKASVFVGERFARCCAWCSGVQHWNVRASAHFVNGHSFCEWHTHCQLHKWTPPKHAGMEGTIAGEAEI